MGLVADIEYSPESAEYARLYGPGRFCQDGLGNLDAKLVGSTYYIVSNRIRAERSGVVSGLRLYWSAGSGYAAGTGGVIRIRCFPDDGTANHRPNLSATPLFTANYTPASRGMSGGNYPNNSDDMFYTVAIPAGTALVGGTLYHIVFDNTDGSPATNWSSIDCATGVQASGHPARWLDPYSWSAMYATGPSSSGPWTWVDRGVAPNSGLYYVPCLQVFMADGSSYGMSNMEAGNVDPSRIWSLTSSYAARERFVPTGAKSIAGYSVRMAKASGSGGMGWVFKNETTGATLASGTIADPGNNYTTDSSAGYAQGVFAWYDVTFGSAQAMDAGSVYTLTLTPISTSSWRISSWRNGSEKGFSYPAAFTESRAEVNSGGGWRKADFWNRSSDGSGDNNFPVVLHQDATTSGGGGSGGTGGGGTGTAGGFADIETTTTTINGSSAAIEFPAGEAGDIRWAAFNVEKAGTPAPPGGVGWDELDGAPAPTFTDNAYKTRAWRRVLTGTTAAGTETFTFGASVEGEAITGNSTGPLQNWFWSESPTFADSNHYLPSVAPTSSGNLTWLGLIGTCNWPRTHEVADSGFLERADVYGYDGVGGRGLWCGTKQITSGSPTGTSGAIVCYNPDTGPAVDTERYMALSMIFGPVPSAGGGSVPTVSGSDELPVRYSQTDITASPSALDMAVGEQSYITVVDQNGIAVDGDRLSASTSTAGATATVAGNQVIVRAVSAGTCVVTTSYIDPDTSETRTDAVVVTVTGSTVIDTSSLPSGTVGVAYSATITHDGTSLSIAQLPPGLAQGTGGDANKIIGTPTLKGVFPVLIASSGAGGLKVTTLLLTIASGETAQPSVWAQKVRGS